MKNITLTLLLLMAAWAAAMAQKPEYVYTEATDLTIVGRLMPMNPASPYNRIDTVKYKGFNPRENQLVRMASGLACTFRTNSRSISILTEYGYMDNPTNTSIISARGYDLYIRKDGKWLWANSGVRKADELDKPLTIISSMDGTEHECLLYLPTYSEVCSVKVGVEKGSSLEALPNPFRHRVAIWGSSYTHGSSTSRAGMAYPAQFSRATGIQMLSIGTSGRCMMQDYFCDVLVDAEADAFVFDSFSNPNAELIRERLVPFIDRLIAAHPGKPLIFQQTIYRERRNFNTEVEEKEQAKMDMAARIFKEIKSTREGRKKYKDVYFITPNACPDSHEASVDGTHPDNYGYTLWEKSVEKPILRILAKYGIK
ncbi:MAG: SGNH/GDSL hydrolase family protein [Bacteroidales bacterium]|nr:SGNH/GDSL hydrolase family protein [Bacteroidales bacterium]